MKRLTLAGVTLLEIMLVLAIAAMIIIMSVRYYQATSQSEQTTSIMQQIQAISAAADQLSQGTGNYANVSTTSVSALVPNGLATPWGKVSITNGGPNAGYISVQFTNVPKGVCSAIIVELQNLGNNYRNFSPTSASGCADDSPVSYEYTSTPNTNQ